jgi:protein TonB
MHTGESLASTWDTSVEERRLRLLALALLGSLVLHALMLFFLSTFREFIQMRAPSSPPLTAHLAKPKPPPEPPKVEPPLLPRLPLARPAAKPQPVAAPAPVAPSPVLSIEPSKQAAEPAFTVPAAPAQPVARADNAQPSLAPASGPDPEAIKRFGIELREIASRYKRYPRVAQDNNWEGRVELRITFAANGALASVAVKKSAGRAILDEEAQAMIRSAQPQATIPPALRGKAFVLEIEVDFRLLKDGVR